MIYHVDFYYKGQHLNDVFPDCHDVGNAFNKCLKKFKGCTLIKATTYRRMFGKDMWIEYKAPSAKGIIAPPNIRMEQPEFELGDSRKPKERREKAAKAGKINA